MGRPHMTVNGRSQVLVLNSYDERATLKNLGARWSSDDKAWMLAFTSDNVKRLLGAIPHMTVDPSVKTRLAEQEAREKQVAEIKELAKRDADTDFTVDGLKATLRPFQKLGVQFALAAGTGALIGDTMGLGKTIQAIATALEMRNRGILGPDDKVLVITPASLKFNWPIEIAKFTKLPYVVIDGPQEKRLSQWRDEKAFFYIANYELLQEDFHGGRKIRKKTDVSPEELARRVVRAQLRRERAACLDPVKNREWGMIIVDEVHAIKGKSARTDNVKALKGRFRLGLSGTPLEGRLEELHSVMDFIMPGLLGTRTRFLQRHAITDYWGRITQYVHIDEVRRKISPFYIRRLKKDVLKELPEKVFQNVLVTLSPEELKLYRKIAKREHPVTEGADAMVASLRAKQVLCHPGLLDIPCGKPSKLKAWREAIEEVVVGGGEKAIVFSQFKKMMPYLQAELEELKIKYMMVTGDVSSQERAAMQDRFRLDDSIRVIIGTDAMKQGFNFETAGYAMHYDNPWSPGIFDQRCDRIHRMGKTGSTNIVEFTCHATIEERIRRVLEEKARVSREVLGDSADHFSYRDLSPEELESLL